MFGKKKEVLVKMPKPKTHYVSWATKAAFGTILGLAVF